MTVGKHRLNLFRQGRRRTILRTIQRLRREQPNDGTAKHACLQLPLITLIETRTGGMKVGRMTLTMDDGFEVDGFSFSLTRAALYAILGYLRRMRERRLI